MYDSHTHLNSPQLAQNIEGVLSRFKKNGGKAILNVAYDFDSNLEIIEFSKKHSLSSGIKIYPALGLHPEVFHSNAQIDKPLIGMSKVTKALEMLHKSIQRNRRDILAIGETGLDYYQIINDESLSLDEKEEQIEMQRYSFREHVKWGLKMNLPLTIHIRDNEGSSDCIKDALKIICEDGKGLVKGVFHSYTGPKEDLNDILNLGFMIGYNGIVTYRSADNVRELLQLTPLSSILIESDAPYLPPAKKRKNKEKNIFKYGEPADLIEIAKLISTRKGRTVEEILEITSKNFEINFGLLDQ